MEQLVATRSELLARTAQIGLAAQGRDVLKEKRDQLMEEFRATVDSAVTGSGALETAATEGRRALAVAESGDGPESVWSAALARPGQIALQVRATKVMGVQIAAISYDPVGRPRVGRGYSLAGSSAYLDRVAEQFEAQAAMLLDLAAVELRLRRIANEIGKTTRRVNAIETVVLPRLEAEKATIRATLDERERQDHFRLKRFAARRAERQEPERSDL